MADKLQPRVVRNEGQRKRALAKSKGKAAAAVEEADEAATQSTEVIDKPRAAQSPRWINRQRTLVFSSRGVSYRARHLMDDVSSAYPPLSLSLSQSRLRNRLACLESRPLLHTAVLKARWLPRGEAAVLRLRCARCAVALHSTAAAASWRTGGR